MTNNDNRDVSTVPDDTRATVERIAELLGCSVDALTGKAEAPLDVAGISELLSIWCEMDDDTDRERLLEFAHQLAASR